MPIYTISRRLDWTESFVHCTNINKALTMCESFFSMLDTKINAFCHSIVYSLALIMKDLQW